MAYMAVKLVSRLKETRQILVSILQQEETCVSLFTLMIQCIQSMVSGSDLNEKLCK